MNYFEKLNLIDRTLHSKSITINQTDKDTVSLISDSEPLKKYFFNNLKHPKWFVYLKDLGYFDPQHNPKPVERGNGYSIPEWEVLIYLEKTSQGTRELDDQMLEIIREVSLYKDENNNHTDNYRTWWYFVKILFNIPLSKVPLHIFKEVIPIWLISKFDLTLPGSDLVNKLLPKYLEQAEPRDIEKVEKLVQLVLSVKKLEKKKSVLGMTIEVQTKIDNYWLEESFIDNENASLIAQKCSNAPIANLAGTITEIFKERHGQQDYSSVWLRDLTRDEKKSLHDSEWLLAVILRKLVLEKSKYHIKDGEEIIKSFLSDAFTHYLFRRLAILLIAEYWDNYKKFFDQILDNKKENYFDIDSFYIELSYLLRKNASSLTKEQRSKIAAIISRGPSKELPDDRKIQYRNYWKQKWYDALILLPEFKKLHDKLLKITKQKIIEKEVGESDVINFDKSPVPIEELLLKKNEDIVQYILNYQPTGDFPHASLEGPYSVFEASVKLNPDKFTEDLTPFRIQDYHLLSNLYGGLEEAWKGGNDIQWENIVKFTSGLLEEKWFWEPRIGDKNKYYDYFDWTISAIGDLIQEGCRRDGRAFPEELNTDVEKIITTLVQKLTYRISSNDEYSGDSVTHALNSSWGKVLTAIIYLALREARLSDKKDEKKNSKWSKSLKSNFEKALEKNIYEAYALLGQYMHNLYYVDKDWVEMHAKNIHLIKNDRLFESFMDGYLFSGNVHENLYERLKDSYKKALTIKFKEARIRERLIQHITVGYLRGNEELAKSSLINRIIQLGNSDYIKEIISFLWHQRDFILNQGKDQDEKEKTRFKEKILIFWDYIIDIYKDKKLTESDKKVLSELSKLSVYISEIDKESYSRLSFSASYVTYDFDSPFFIEYLNQLKESGNKAKSAEYIGKLFLAMLHGAKDLIPDYEWENIEEIVNYLYTVNEKTRNLANQICIFYGEKGNLRLRSLYEKHNDVSPR